MKSRLSSLLPAIAASTASIMPSRLIVSFRSIKETTCSANLFFQFSAAAALRAAIRRSASRWAWSIGSFDIAGSPSSCGRDSVGGRRTPSHTGVTCGRDRRQFLYRPGYSARRAGGKSGYSKTRSVPGAANGGTYSRNRVIPRTSHSAPAIAGRSDAPSGGAPAGGAPFLGVSSLNWPARVVSAPALFGDARG